MPFRHVAQWGREKIQTALNLLCDPAAWHHPQPTGSQFNPKRHSLDHATDSDYSVRILSQRETYLRLLRTLVKELHRTIAFNRVVCLLIWEWQAVYGQYPFLLDVQPFARRDENFHLWRVH